MNSYTRKYLNFLNWLEKPVLFAAGLCMALAVINTGLGLLFEAIVGQSLAWGEEMNTLFFCWTSFLGAGVVARYGGHIGVDTIIDFFPEKLKKIIYWFHTVLAIIIVWVMFYYGVKLALFVGKSQTSIYLDISLTYYYLSVPVGGIILGLNSLGFVLEGSKRHGH